MQLLSILLDIITLTIIFQSVLKSYKKNHKFNLFIMFSMMYAIYYVVAPILYKLTNYTYDSMFMISMNQVYPYEYVFTSFYIFSMYIIFMLCTRIKIKKFDVNQETEKENSDPNNSRIRRVLVVLGWITLIVGGGSLLFIAKSVGGINNLISIGDRARGFGKDLGDYINRNLLPLRALMQILLASPYLFYTANKIRISVSCKLLFLISGILCIIYLLFNAGKAPMILFIAPFIFCWIVNKFKHPLIILAIIGLCAIPIFIFLDNLFFYLSYDRVNTSIQELNIIQYFIGEFSYPFVNAMNRMELLEYTGVRLGLDYFTWLINMVPVAILSKFGLWKVPIISDYTTIYYAGLAGIVRPMGGIPVDILMLGYFQMGVIGSSLIMGVLGFTSRVIDKYSRWMRDYNIYEVLIYRIIISIAFLLPNASLDSFFRGKMDVVVLILTFGVIIYLKKGKRFVTETI